MATVKIELTDEDQMAIQRIVDIALKSSGLGVMQGVLMLLSKLETARETSKQQEKQNGSSPAIVTPPSGPSGKPVPKAQESRSG